MVIDVYRSMAKNELLKPEIRAQAEYHLRTKLVELEDVILTKKKRGLRSRRFKLRGVTYE